MIEWKNIDSFSARSWWFHLDRDKGSGSLYRLRLEEASLPDHTIVRVKRGTLRFAKSLEYDVIAPHVVNLISAATLFKLRPVSEVKKIPASLAPPRKNAWHVSETTWATVPGANSYMFDLETYVNSLHADWSYAYTYPADVVNIEPIVVEPPHDPPQE